MSTTFSIKLPLCLPVSVLFLSYKFVFVCVSLSLSHVSFFHCWWRIFSFSSFTKDEGKSTSWCSKCIVKSFCPVSISIFDFVHNFKIVAKWTLLPTDDAIAKFVYIYIHGPKIALMISSVIFLIFILKLDYRLCGKIWGLILGSVYFKVFSLLAVAAEGNRPNGRN